MAEIPYDRLGVPPELRQHVEPGAPLKARMAAAKGLVPTTMEAQLGMLYILANDENRIVRDAARKTIVDLPSTQVVKAIHQHTHTKIMELLATLRGEDQEIGGRIFGIRNANDRTAILIAEQAEEDLVDRIIYNQERMLITPDVYLALFNNPRCSDEKLEKLSSFLRMHRQLPQAPDRRPFQEGGVKAVVAGGAGANKPVDAEMDLEAEIEAALLGKQSPTLVARTENALKMFDLSGVSKDDDLFGGFDFDFKDDMSNFSWDMMEEKEERPSHDERRSLEHQINDMTVGQKIKLAYLGNKEVRNVLIRDRNKLVAAAVVKSGRCTDGEIAHMAGNRNLHDDVLREIASNPEWTRKYPVKVALVNNPKVPVSVVVGLVSQLQKRDLMELSRNHNVPSVICGLAKRIFKQKFKR